MNELWIDNQLLIGGGLMVFYLDEDGLIKSTIL
jgi:hypothetical protein